MKSLFPSVFFFSASHSIHFYTFFSLQSLALIPLAEASCTVRLYSSRSILPNNSTDGTFYTIVIKVSSGVFPKKSPFSSCLFTSFAIALDDLEANKNYQIIAILNCQKICKALERNVTTPWMKNWRRFDLLNQQIHFVHYISLTFKNLEYPHFFFNLQPMHYECALRQCVTQDCRGVLAMKEGTQREGLYHWRYHRARWLS